ncbi:transposase [Glaciimonas sp. CA11.2]|uniref:transposase n=1 Tax=Glaciimonas sp. CA11.2 TaxID=3048601 RepID=UPI002AB3CEE0|nr:transposase [Glaciimonas sp. CA11.2]MDY7546738.1 transposase [Glaciimonas sp. CA11.2]MEB0162887.1 transposase [Glaciimonas sp. CA11.2]
MLKRSRDGRCQYDRRTKRELVEASLQPDISVAKLAYQHALNANLLRKWIVQYHR